MNLKTRFKDLIKKLFESESYWNLYLKLYDEMSNFPPYRKMLRDVYIALEIDRHDDGIFLDAGCGTGNFIIYSLLNNPNVEFYCFDMSVEGLKILETKLNKYNLKSKANFLRYTFRNSLPYDDNKFDGIGAINLIQYFDYHTLENFIRECRRVLRKYGRIALVYPSEKINFRDAIKEYKKMFDTRKSIVENVRYSIILVAIGILNIPMRLNVNLNIYSREEIEGLLERYGFTEISHKPTYYSKIATLTSGTLFK